MAVSKSINGGNTTVKFEYTATTAKVEDTLTDAAKYLYDKITGHGVVLSQGETVNDLTVAEIGAICDTFVRKALVDAAKTYNTTTSVEAAKTTAETANTTKYL